MEKNDVARPISTILDETKYIIWAHQMRSFLIGRKLWCIVTGDATKPVKPTPLVKNIKDTTENDDTDTFDVTTEDDKYIEKLEDWDNKNHQIITWLGNTSIPATHTQFDTFNTSKELWNFLLTRFQSIGLAQYYQLNFRLISLSQEGGQSVNE